MEIFSTSMIQTKTTVHDALNNLISKGGVGYSVSLFLQYEFIKTFSLPPNNL